MFANIDDIALKNAFDGLSIKVLLVAENSLLDTPVSRHADILANYVGKSIFLADKNQKELCNFVEKRMCSIELESINSSSYLDNFTKEKFTYRRGVFLWFSQ